MGTPLRVLIVEDSDDDCTLLVRRMRRQGYDVAYERVETPSAMSAALDAQTWDLVISDNAMPYLDALAALAILQERELAVPFIIISGQIGEDAAITALEAGADDYLMKDKLARLQPALERALRKTSRRRERDDQG
jgi:DNA-binding NtrC family response regulator